MVIEYSFSKKALIDALESRRGLAKKYDEKCLKQHKIDEQKFLKDFKNECKKALKWDYNQLLKNNCSLPGFGGTWKSKSKPTCPKSMLVMLDKALESIKKDGRNRYVIKHLGWTSDIHHLLTFDDKAKVEMC